MFEDETDSYFFLQQGYSRNPLLGYLAEDIGDGLIVCPAYLPEHQARGFISKVQAREKLAIFDPMTFLMRFGRDNCHRSSTLSEYPYLEFGKYPKDFAKASARNNLARGVVDYQVALGVNAVIAPGIWFDGLTDPWFQVSIDLAQAAVNHVRENHGDIPIFVPVYMDGTHLKNEAAMLEFADNYTTIYADGFYLCLDPRWNDAAPSRDAELLAGWMRFINILYRNDYFVVVSYVNGAAILLLASGATGFGSGIHYTNRKFSLGQFVNRASGIRRTSLKFYSPILMNSINVDGQLPFVFDAGLLGEIRGNAEYCDDLFDGREPSSSRWSNRQSWKSYLSCCQTLADKMHGMSVEDRLELAKSRLRRGRRIYGRLAHQGVRFDDQSGPGHLIAFERAISLFESETTS